MTIYSKLLARGTINNPGTSVVYVAPAAGVVVVRDIVLLQDDSVGRRIAIFRASGSGAAWITSTPGASPNLSFHWDGRQVLEPGEALYLVSDSPGNVAYSISGYLLVS